MVSFGFIIKKAREDAGILQKDLASSILKENGIPISPAYLNDLEHDRRQPPSDSLIEQLASSLKLPDANLLYYLANRFPPALRALPQADKFNITKAFQSFGEVLGSD